MGMLIKKQNKTKSLKASEQVKEMLNSRSGTLAAILWAEAHNCPAGPKEQRPQWLPKPFAPHNSRRLFLVERSQAAHQFPAWVCFMLRSTVHLSFFYLRGGNFFISVLFTYLFLIFFPLVHPWSAVITEKSNSLPKDYVTCNFLLAAG